MRNDENPCFVVVVVLFLRIAPAVANKALDLNDSSRRHNAGYLRFNRMPFHSNSFPNDKRLNVISNLKTDGCSRKKSHDENQRQQQLEQQNHRQLQSLRMHEQRLQLFVDNRKHLIICAISPNRCVCQATQPSTTIQQRQSLSLSLFFMTMSFTVQCCKLLCFFSVPPTNVKSDDMPLPIQFTCNENKIQGEDTPPLSLSV